MTGGLIGRISHDGYGDNGTITTKALHTIPKVSLEDTGSTNDDASMKSAESAGSTQEEGYHLPPDL
jgi:hypothetical protein